MSLRAGDRAPKAVAFPLECGTTDPALVHSVRVKVVRADGREVEWSPTVGNRAGSTVALIYVLAPDGSSVPVPGEYSARAWAYDVNGDVLFDSEPQTFPVEENIHTWPT